MAIIISYPTSASGIIVLLKTPQKYRKVDTNRNVSPSSERIGQLIMVIALSGVQFGLKSYATKG